MEFIHLNGQTESGILLINSCEQYDRPATAPAAPAATQRRITLTITFCWQTTASDSDGANS